MIDNLLCKGTKIIFFCQENLYEISEKAVVGSFLLEYLEVSEILIIFAENIKFMKLSV